MVRAALRLGEAGEERSFDPSLAYNGPERNKDVGSSQH